MVMAKLMVNGGGEDDVDMLLILNSNDGIDSDDRVARVHPCQGGGHPAVPNDAADARATAFRQGVQRGLSRVPSNAPKCWGFTFVGI